MTSGAFGGGQHEAILQQCKPAVAACKELSNSADPVDLALAFKGVAAYLPILDVIARDIPYLRTEALELAATCALLKTILGWHRKGFTSAIHYARSAQEYSAESGNISLQLSAYSKLAWAYFLDKKYPLALHTAEAARSLLEENNQPGKQPLSSCIQGGTYSTLALMQARNNQPSDEALGKATEIEPSTQSVAMMAFTSTDQLHEAAKTRIYQGNQTEALKLLEQLIDPETLEMKTQHHERGRLGIIRDLALSSLRTKERDMGKTVYFWQTGMEGSRALQSEWGLQEFTTVYELMECVWPGETGITQLRDLTIHW